jgi:hypothetical protein
VKEAIKIDPDGYFVEPVIVHDSQIGVQNISEQVFHEGSEEPEEVLVGYIIAEKVPDGLFKPRWDFTLWEAYNTALATARDTYEQAIADWAALPEDERGERPEYVEPIRPNCWVEGLAQEEIDEIRKGPSKRKTWRRFWRL